MILKGIVSLLGGVVLTVLVAWLNYLAPNPSRGIFLIKPNPIAAAPHYNFERRESGGVEFLFQEHKPSFGLTSTLVTLNRSDPDRSPLKSQTTGRIVEREYRIASAFLEHARSANSTATQSSRVIGFLRYFEAGFPLRSMSCWTETRTPLGSGPDRRQKSVLLPIWFQRKFNGLRFELPLRPLPLGFTLNTLFYAGIVFGVWEGLGFAKRARRRRHRKKLGLCTECAHSLEGLPEGSPCPECGTASKPSTLSA